MRSSASWCRRHQKTRRSQAGNCRAANCSGYALEAKNGHDWTKTNSVTDREPFLNAMKDNIDYFNAIYRILNGHYKIKEYYYTTSVYPPVKITGSNIVVFCAYVNKNTQYIVNYNAKCFESFILIH